jgi:hypothetical protein
MPLDYNNNTIDNKLNNKEAECELVLDLDKNQNIINTEKNI